MELKDHFQQAISLHQAGELNSARLIYEQILAKDDTFAGAWHLLGVLFHQQGDSETGEEYVSRATLLRPQSSTYRNNLGVIYLSRGKLDDAYRAFLAAVEINGTYADAWLNLAHVAVKLGRSTEVTRVLNHALVSAPNCPSVLTALAHVLFADGRDDEAIAQLTAVLQTNPSDVRARLMLGEIYLSLRDGEQAVTQLESVAAAGPPTPKLADILGSAYEYTGEIATARTWFAKAAALDQSSPLRRLRQKLCCPLVFNSQSHITEYREELSHAIEEWRTAQYVASPEELVASGCFPPYQLSHQAECNLQLKSALSDSFSHCIPLTEISGPAHGHWKVGFIVTPGDEAMFCRLFLPLAEGLLREGLKPVIVCPSRVRTFIRQALREEIAFLTIPEQIREAISVVTTAKFDILYYHKVDASPFNYFLAQHRLAPIQFTSLGIQDTTGMRSIDYYLSSELIETPSSQDHYREQLIPLASLPCAPVRLNHVKTAKTRVDFGISDRKRLYLCNQKILKYHPTFDQALLQLLDADSHGIVAITAGFPERGYQALATRLQPRLGSNFARIRFMPWLSHFDYLQLVSLADVILDTFPAGACATFFDALEAGTPIVTLPSRFQRGRFSLGALNSMGLKELTTSSLNEFVARAVEIASNRELRRHYSIHIRQQATCLLASDKCASQVAEFIKKLS